MCTVASTEFESEAFFSESINIFLSILRLANQIAVTKFDFLSSDVYNYKYIGAFALFGFVYQIIKY
jgi:hypothetical protein